MTPLRDPAQKYIEAHRSSHRRSIGNAIVSGRGKGFPVAIDNGREILERDFAETGSKRAKGKQYTPMQIVRMRFEQGMSYAAIGKIVGLSRERVRQRLIMATREAYLLQTPFRNWHLHNRIT